jgi:hypothetical protein
MISEQLRAAARFTLITLALAGTYLLLQQGWMALGGLGADWWQARQNAALVDDAQVLATRSREAEAEARLPPQRRVDAFRLGQQMGFLAEYLGSHALSDAAVRAQAEARAAPLAAQAGTLAEVLGVAPAVWPAVSTADEFARLQARFESDETGLGGRIERVLSPRHREIYLLGVHAGVNRAVLQTSGGVRFNGPSASLLVRHATLAGLPPAWWEALSRAPEGATPEARHARFIAAIEALDAALAAPASARP